MRQTFGGDAMLPELRHEMEEADLAPAERGPAAQIAGSLRRMARAVSALPARALRAAARRGVLLDGAQTQDLAQDLRGLPQGLAYLRHFARGNRIRRRRFYERATGDRPPVLLLHGFLGTRGSMYLLERRLVEDGFCVISFNLGMVNWRDIRASAFLVHRKIESILAQTSVQQIDIVGHSMGGLIGLYYLKKLGGAEKVRKLVMLGTPHHGTWIALAGVAALGLLSTSSWQLLPGSRLLRELSDGPLPPGVELYTIAAQRDWFCPVDSTRLDGAVAATVPLGHAGLVMSEEVYRHVRDALRTPAAAARVTAAGA